MFLKRKKEIVKLIETVLEMVDVLVRINDQITAINDCRAAMQSISNTLLKEKTSPIKTLDQIKKVQSIFEALLQADSAIDEKTMGTTRVEILQLKAILSKEIKAKLNVVFFPYKVEMWDSLASIYEAANKDPDCIAKVVPIPYYQLSQDEAYHCYEGDKFPKDLPITHYNEYNLQIEQPDMIFVHNIYDQYNTLTQVHKEYFTENLKKYTAMLVYVPYHISPFYKPKPEEGDRSFNLPSVKNVDKIVLAGDYLLEPAIQFGIPKEKLLSLGSPKFDALKKSLEINFEYPTEWADEIKGKNVYLLNTGCMFFVDPLQGHIFLERVFDISRYLDNVIIIWRPHPLTEIMIKKYVPNFNKVYVSIKNKIKEKKVASLKNVILDEAANYIPALKVSDALISGEGSLLRSYLLTEKKIVFYDRENLKQSSMIPSDAFYYFFDPDLQWYDLFKLFAKGKDSLMKNRKNLASKAYANTDGTCGKKVYYAVKESVLTKF